MGLLRVTGNRIAVGLTWAVLMTSSCKDKDKDPPADGGTSTTVRTADGIAVYASGDKTLWHFDLDAETGALTARGSWPLPERIQYAAPDPKRKFLYVAASNFSDKHLYAAFTVDPATGALQPHGDQMVLPQRPIHVTVDHKGEFLLGAFNNVNTLSAHRLAADGKLGAAVEQPAPAAGFYTHQVRFLGPKTVVACALGQDPRTVTGDGGTTMQPEELGRLHLFPFEDGKFGTPTTITPGAGIGPRHLDLHPSKSWMYVAAERGNRLLVYTHDGSAVTAPAAFTVGTLKETASATLPRQRAGAIHVHPNGRWLYLTNRNDRTTNEPAGDGGTVAVFAGGENNLAVYSLDQATGAPTLLQHEETRGVEPRTFTIDPTGKFLIVANQRTVRVREGETLRTISQNLAVFRIGTDGRLTFVATTDITSGEAWWVGAFALPRP